jgi:hypothetical protein
MVMKTKHINYNNNTTEHVLQMLYFSEYFEEVDSDYEVNEREQGRVV